MHQPAPVRTRVPGRRARQKSSIVPRLLIGAGALYLAALGAFALLHYDGSRADARDVVSEFHAFLGVGPSTAAAEVAPPPPAPPPPRPVVVKPSPPPAPPPPRERTRLERVADTLREVRKEAPALKRMDRGPGFDAARIDVLSRLSDARDLLNGVLDENPDHRRGNELWDRLQELMAAFRKL
jgi:hypothetical protein